MNSFSNFSNTIPVVGFGREGLAYTGVCTNASDSTTSVTVASLAGYRDDSLSSSV